MFDKRRLPVARDYKERFEFKLTVGQNIICQRYFKIRDFNWTSLYSEDLMDSIRRCVEMIDKDLKSKTLDYLEYFAPHYFNSVEEMTEYFSQPNNKNRVRPGHGIVVKNAVNDYYLNKNNKQQLFPLKTKSSRLIIINIKTQFICKRF